MLEGDAHGPARGGYATSGNGSDWTKYAGNPLPGLEPGLPGAWDDYGVFPSAIVFDGANYRMWYIGWGGDPDPWVAPHAIGYAVSANGIDWSKRPDPVLEATVPWENNKVYDPEVVPWGDGFAMWYSGASTSGSSVGYAVSPGDPEFGVDWRKWTGNPVITPVGCNAVDSTAVLVEGDVLHAWVSNCWDDIWHLTSSPLDAASFFDGFESGDTGVWGTVVP